MNKKRLFINLVSSLLSFVLQLGISFILTPIIVEKVGTAAYGFIGLSSNFVSYANIFTVIINSMAGRFVTVELVKSNIEGANKYYSSVFLMNIIMSILTVIATIILMINISFLKIPDYLVKDVSITFVLAAINLILSLIGTVFGIATFAKNRLDISSVKSIIGNIIKAIFLILLFSCFSPKIYFITLAGVVASIYFIITNIRITKKLLPELIISIKYFDYNYIKTLCNSGIWNSINNLSRTLLTGLDLLIANLFVGADAMGILSIAKTIPNNIEGLLTTIVNSFTPQFIMLYSKGKIEELVRSINFSLKVLGMLMIVPMAGFIVFGEDFFSLWLPSKTSMEIRQIQVLSILSLLPYVISANNFTLFIIDTVTNKLKRPVIVSTLMSIVSTVTTFILLKTTDLGIYAIAAVSSFYWCFKVVFFNTINCAVNLNIKWNTFFKQFLINIAYFLCILLLFIYLKPFLTVDSWKTFAFSIALLAIIGYALVFVFILNKNDKKILIEYINRILKKSI